MNFKEARDALLQGNLIKRRSKEEMLMLVKKDDTIVIKSSIVVYQSFNIETHAIFTNNWIVLGQEDEYLDFPDAVIKIKQGFKIRHINWPECEYIELTENQREIHHRVMFFTDKYFYLEDFLADDYEIVNDTGIINFYTLPPKEKTNA